MSVVNRLKNSYDKYNYDSRPPSSRFRIWQGISIEAKKSILIPRQAYDFVTPLNKRNLKTNSPNKTHGWMNSTLMRMANPLTHLYERRIFSLLYSQCTFLVLAGRLRKFSLKKTHTQFLLSFHINIRTIISQIYNPRKHINKFFAIFFYRRFCFDSSIGARVVDWHVVFFFIKQYIKHGCSLVQPGTLTG